jgi:hypothetical protein
MELLVDTNILYYQTGFSTIASIDNIKLETELSKYELVISKWTLVEIISKHDISEQDKDSVLKYIIDKGIIIMPINGISTFDFIPLNLSDIIYSPDKSRIINAVINEKKECETEFISCYINSVVCIFSIALYYRMESKAFKDKGSFMDLTQSFIINNNDFVISKVKEFIENFYINNDEALFRSEIDGFTYTLLYANVISFLGVKQGYTHDLFDNIENILTEIERDELTGGTLSLSVINSLLKKMVGEEIRNISKKIGNVNIKKALSDYKTVVGTQMAEGICNFILTMIEKMFSDGMKITKNDVIDSQLLYYYPKLQIFTFDNRLRRIIKDFDEHYYNFILDLENKCKI